MPLSYRMERGPGIKDGFTREKRGRVSLYLSRRAAAESVPMAGGTSGNEGRRGSVDHDEEAGEKK